MTEQRSAADRWEIDRRIPVALIFALVLQFGGAVWFAADTASRVQSLESRTAAMADTAAKVAQISERLASVETLLRVMVQRTTDDTHGSRSP